MAVAGDDYCIVAASTRMSTGFQILKRDSSMILKLCAHTTYLQHHARMTPRAMSSCNVSCWHCLVHAGPEMITAVL